MQPKVVNLGALPADVRAYLLGGLRGSFAVQLSRARGWGWSIAFACVMAIVWFFHSDGHPSYGSKLYAPTTFVYMGFFAFLTVMPTIAFIRMRKSLQRQPSQGVFLIGANTVVATEQELTIFPFAQSQFSRVAINLSVTCMGRVFTFALPGRVFEVEQTAKANANALAAAVHYGDQAQIQALDPFIALAATPPAKKPLPSWLIALPATTLSLPLVFVLERRIDDRWYESAQRYLSKYDVERYVEAGGRHGDELHHALCDQELKAAETPPAIRHVLEDCKDYQGEIDQKLANLYAKIRVQLEAMPAKSRPVLIELLDASIKGPVTAKFVVSPPTAAELKDIDKRLDKGRINDVVRLTGNFDPSSMDSRTKAIRDAIVNEINALGPSEAFRVVEDDKAESPGLTITLAYSLEPMIQGDQIIIYRETGLGAARSTVFLGLRTHIELKLQSKSGASYSIAVDAEPQAHVSHDTSASDRGIYNAITDSAFDDLHKALKAKLFPTAATAK